MNNRQDKNNRWWRQESGAGRKVNGSGIVWRGNEGDQSS